jgi:ribosome-interacting GTPase 1
VPANLTPQYKEAEARYRRATSPEEKLSALREMLAVIPKHKGTEKLQGDLRKRLSKLQSEIRQRSRSGSRHDVYHVEKEGNPQVVVIGPANAGKSLLVSRLAGVELEVAPYPYSTGLPAPVMMEVGGAQVQLVDCPPAVGAEPPSWYANLVRKAEAVLLVVDAGDEESIGVAGELIEALAGRRVSLGRGPREDDETGRAVRPAILVANKVEGKEQEAGLALLQEMHGRDLDVYPVSAEEERGTTELREKIFGMLGLIRIFTKQPGKDPDRKRPFLLPEGSTVEDLARAIHKELAVGLKFARIWGSSRFEGQQVSGHHGIHDGDVVELHL